MKKKQRRQNIRKVPATVKVKIHSEQKHEANAILIPLGFKGLTDGITVDSDGFELLEFSEAFDYLQNIVGKKFKAKFVPEKPQEYKIDFSTLNPFISSVKFSGKSGDGA